MKHNMLIAALGITFVFVAVSAWVVQLSQRPLNAPGTHGPLQVSFVGVPGQNEQAAAKAYPRALLLSLSPGFHDTGVQNDRMVHIVNAGRLVLTMPGFNTTAPWYGIEVKRGGVWSLSMMAFTSLVPGQPTLKPGESLDFPVMVPERTEAWRVRLGYDELAASDKLTHLWDRVLKILHQPRRARSESFIAWSAVVTP